MKLDRKKLEQLAERLGIAFYALMSIAFISTVIGSPGVGLAFLILGALAHVLRATIEDFITKQGSGAEVAIGIPSLNRREPAAPLRRSQSARPRR